MDYSCFIEPPVQSSQRVKSPSPTRFIESPVKVTKRQNEENFISPYRPPKQSIRGSDFIESPTQPVRRKKSSAKRDRSRRTVKPREKKKNVDHESWKDDGGYSEMGGFGDGGGSPEKGGFMDGINWGITGDDVEELRSKAVQEYWESLLDSPFGAVRVTDRLYILKDWHPMGYLMDRQYRHVYRMVDITGIVGTSCDCRPLAGRCTHSMLIEQYHTQFEEPVFDGEEPAAFLLYSNYRDLLYLFSVGTASGSARNHSHKRTIVTCDLSGRWHCKSCSRSLECRHIQASKENLKSLPGFTHTSSLPEAAELFTRSQAKPVDRRCVSHLPIPPPAWCRLPTDAMASQKPPQDFPDLFLLDNSSRCSCGNSDYTGVQAVTTNLYVIYTPSTALRLEIQTVYCSVCSNTHGRIGPDLSNYGVLNWNNKIGFAHQVLNQYTSHVTRSETPFNAFYGTIQDEYLSNESPVAFCVNEIFESAWLAFVRLQKIESKMQCSICGPHPKVVIADGISVSFPNHHRTDTLRPPTVSDKTQAWVSLKKTATRSTSFVGPVQNRNKIYGALNTQDREKRLEKLHPEIEDLKRLSGNDFQDYTPYIDCLTRYHSLETAAETNLRDYTKRYKQLLTQVFSPDSVLQLVPHAAISLLLEYSTSGVVDERLKSLIPALGMIFLNTPADRIDSPDLRKLSGALANRAKLAFNDLVNRRDIMKSTREHPSFSFREWEETGCFYGRPPIRHRPFYEGRDNDKQIDAAESGKCKKYYSTYGQQTLTGGIMAIWCPHLICLGFHKIPVAEGRNDVFSALYVYFEQAPEVVIYDFACQLGTYSRSREPEFFKDTCFAIDEMHAKGHSSCSQASFSSNYMQGRASLQSVNTSAAECSNRGLNRIRKSVSYMGQRNAILLTMVYLCVWNRRQEREFQLKTVKESRTLQSAFHCSS